MKTIKITKCKTCPHFSGFPAEYYDGTCAHRGVAESQDPRITDEDSIPKWCPL